MWRAGRLSVALVVCVASLQAAIFLTPSQASAQTSLAIVEVVASNDSNVDSFGETSDWIEIQNFGPSVSTAGWTITDTGAVWALPTLTVGTGQRIIIRASGRDVIANNELHSNFRLSATSGETLTLADATGVAVNTLTFPALGADQSYGRAVNGDIGYLDEVTFNATNSVLAPPIVTFDTPAQAFVASLDVELSTNGGATIRYTTDGSTVSSSSRVYDGPIAMTTSTVLRAAVVDNGNIGPESSAAYIAITSALEGQSSDLPMVLMQKTTTASLSGSALAPTVMSIVAPGADGRTVPLGEVDYLGFAGMRIRGASSIDFPKKQYRIELWSDPNGTEIRSDLLGLGADGDWGLYAPGRFDRAMINNPFMYELAHRIGVVAPDYQFVELYLETDPGRPVGSGDYQGLYVLRETVEVAESRVDVTKHTDTSAGGSGGYIVGFDWSDNCCYNIASHPNFGSRIISKDPGVEGTSGQKSWITSRWEAIQSAASARDYAAADALVDFDSVIDHWLLEMVAKDVDALRASHFLHLDAGGELMGGPLWDFDRALGGADWRVDDLIDAEPLMNFYTGNSDRDREVYKWSVRGGNLIRSDIYTDFWYMPEVQSQLRARWAELRAGVLSDLALEILVDQMGSDITEAYSRELTVWNDSYRGAYVDGSNNQSTYSATSPQYGPRFGGGLDGELSHMKEWLQRRTAWIDGELISNSNPPSVDNPGTLVVNENDSTSLQIEASGSSDLFFDISGLPRGLSMDANGLITGTVAYGDSGTFPVQLTVTKPSGAATTIDFTIEVPSIFDGTPKVVLNEYNSVEPGRLLDNGGTDLGFGTIGGNAGDWFELVTLEDNLDMRGWSFELWSNDADGVMTQNAELVLGNDPLLVDIRAGTIITIAESIADSLSYAPDADDWTMNWQANSAAAGALFATQTDFDTNNSKWRLIVRDAARVPAAVIAGETEPWDELNGGVSGREVFALSADPAPGVDPVTDYLDTTTSTFGLPNLIGQNGQEQNFDALRPALSASGDVNCDGEFNIVDAYDVARFSVSLITDSGGCPISSDSEIHASAGDLSGDDVTNVLDASVIARCVVGLPDAGCPE